MTGHPFNTLKGLLIYTANLRPRPTSYQPTGTLTQKQWEALQHGRRHA